MEEKRYEIMLIALFFLSKQNKTKEHEYIYKTINDCVIQFVKDKSWLLFDNSERF